MAKVSVIVPNYNHSKFLNQRLESILNQTYQDFELIILDDCSTDNSQEIILNYAGLPKVAHIVINDENSGGTFKQWFKGISLARGEYIWIAESDDYASFLFLENMLERFQENNRIEVVFCLSTLVNESGIPIGKLPHFNSKIMNRLEFLYGTFIPNASSVLFKRVNAEQLDHSFTNYRICGDWHFWYQASRRGEIEFINMDLNFFRQINTSVSRSSVKKDNYKVFLLEKLKMGDYIIEKEQNNIPVAERKIYFKQSILLLTLESLKKKIKLERSDVFFIWNLLRKNELNLIKLFLQIFLEVLLMFVNKQKRLLKVLI